MGCLAAATLAGGAGAKKIQPVPQPPRGHVTAGNRPPEFEYPPYHRVAPGQKIAFGLHAIDQDSDTIAIELVEKPASASYDPLTLTVSWKPTAKDAPHGRFKVRVTETAHKRAYTFDFSIAVDAAAKGALPAPPPLGRAVEELITIRDPARLAQVNKDWPLAKMLDQVRTIAIAKLPEAERGAVAKGTGEDTYKDVLRGMARVHANPRLDPDSKSFDAAAFGKSSLWKITAVRPRLDKKVQELRVVYEAISAPEPVYLMFRLRYAKDVPVPDPADVESNNKQIAKLTLDTFFTGKDLNPKFDKDKKAHGKAVSAYVTAIATKGDFIALPHEARMGGGTKRGADAGTYESGDGWAWAVFKGSFVDAEKGKRFTMAPVPIPGFTTDVRPSADGGKWQTVCAPKFDPDDPSHKPGYEVLCRKKLGFTDLPATGPDEKIVPGIVDATNLYVEHKTKDMVALVDLRDPRRDLFEENGMTCSQCHVRDFANGDLRDFATRDPRVGKLPAASPPLPTLFFNIVPEETWRPFTLEFQQFQECLIKESLQKFGGVETALACPLVAE